MIHECVTWALKWFSINFTRNFSEKSRHLGIHMECEHSVKRLFTSVCVAVLHPSEHFPFMLGCFLGWIVILEATFSVTLSFSNAYILTIIYQKAFIFGTWGPGSVFCDSIRLGPGSIPRG